MRLTNKGVMFEQLKSVSPSAKSGYLSLVDIDDAELSDLLKLMKETTMKIDYDDISVEEEESLKRIIYNINNELIRSQNRWIAALFLMLKDAGIEPSSKDIVNALRRIDENAKHSA